MINCNVNIKEERTDEPETPCTSNVVETKANESEFEYERKRKRVAEELSDRMISMQEEKNPLFKGMDWSNEKTLFFIELYEKRTVLWDIKHPEHKNRIKLNEAWLDLQREFDASIPILELKKKKESLMSSYRPLRRKVVESECTASCPGEVFKPSWYAFEAIDRIMSTREERTKTINSEDGWIRETQPDEEEMPNAGDMPEEESVSSHANVHAESNSFMKPVDAQPSNMNVPHKKRREHPPQVDIGITSSLNEAFQALNTLSSRLPQSLDQCSIFGQLVAEQLRQLSPRNRILTQSKLSNILEKALLEELDHPPSTPLSQRSRSPENSSASTVSSPSMFIPEQDIHIGNIKILSDYSIGFNKKYVS